MNPHLSTTPQENWLNPKGQNLIIAGPCSVETPDQIYLTVKQLAETKQVDVVRGGIWKPRTRPNAFEGLGEAGLPILKESSRAFGLPCMTEVATAGHVEDALRHNVDMLWIGARTTVNPFAVQAIADALRGVDVPVWVKNPVNPDLGLWLGALERLNGVGVKKLGLVHRGFTPLGKTVLRNMPEWPLAMKMRQELPEIPMVCDPSHIAGRRDLLTSIAQKSLDLGMNGLMVESHHNPELAWSDAKQQITPKELSSLIDQLQTRQLVKKGGAFMDQLEELIVSLESRLQQMKVLAGFQEEESILQLLAKEGVSLN